jgi:pSer/pThr/pTyr-binding forkhead associated (FHA) protein
MSAELVVVKGKDRGVTLTLRADAVHTIGRSDGQDLRLKGDKKVSTSHAKITVTGLDRFMLEDLGSTNGTFVNGERVQASPLRSGDRVKIGHTLLVFRTDASQVNVQDLDSRAPRDDEDEDEDDATQTPAPDYVAKLKSSSSAHRRSATRSSPALDAAVLGLGEALEEKDLRARLDRVLRVVLQATGAARAIVFVRDADGGGLAAAAAIGRDDAKENAPVESEILRQAVGGALAAPSGDGKAAAAPLRAGAAVLGALYVDDPAGRKPEPAEGKILTLAASVVGLALKSERLERLAESAIEVVSLAQAEVRRGAIDIVPIVEAASRLYAPVAEAKGLKFETRVPPSLRILGDETLVSRALDRLIESALVSAKTLLRVAVEPEGNVARVLVTRGGQPLPEGLAAELVGPTGPAGDLRTSLARLSDGGLALVRAAIARSGGRLVVEAGGIPDAVGRGGTERMGPAPAVTYTLELPVAT